MKRIVLSVALFSALAVGHAVLAGEVKTFAGHTITTEGENPNVELKIDGQTVHTNAILTLEKEATVAGVPVIVGNSSDGGNACNGTPFVISFPKGGKPRLDGPIDDCAYIEYEVRAKQISFHTYNVPGQGAERWVWTPAGGLKQIANEPFVPDAGTGWDALRTKKWDHPADIFKNEEIAKELKQLLGAKFAEFEQIAVGTGGGEFEGDDFVGSACTPHMCGDEEAMIFLSARDHKIYAAWKPSGQKILVYPPVKQWSKKARLELKDWAGKWQ
jgi:hypothetical protein